MLEKITAFDETHDFNYYKKLLAGEAAGLKVYYRTYCAAYGIPRSDRENPAVQGLNDAERLADEIDYCLYGTVERVNALIDRLEEFRQRVSELDHSVEPPPLPELRLEDYEDDSE